MTATYNPSGLGISDNKISTIGVSLQDSEGMLHILAESNNFQVIQPVVGFVPILVVDSHLFGDPDKGLRNEPMNVSGRFLATDTKNNLFVAIGGVNVAMKESGLLALDPNDSTDASQAAHLIQGKIFNRSPFFHTCHLTEVDMYTQGRSS